MHKYDFILQNQVACSKQREIQALKHGFHRSILNRSNPRNIEILIDSNWKRLNDDSYAKAIKAQKWHDFKV